MKYSRLFLMTLLMGDSSAIHIDRQNLVQQKATANTNSKRISLESQKTITDAVNDVIKITQERDPDEASPKVAVHAESSSSASPVAAYSQSYPYSAPPIPHPVGGYPGYYTAASPYAPAPVPVPAVAPAAFPALAAATPAPVVAPVVKTVVKPPEVIVEKTNPEVVVEKEVPKVLIRDPTPSPANQAPNSGVMRAIAAANEQSAADKVKEEREVADKLEKLERQSVINDAINKSVKEEEQKVIEEANRRMAEVHARKAQEANKAAQDIEKAKSISKTFIDKAKKEEADAINKIVTEHSGNVVK